MSLVFGATLEAQSVDFLDPRSGEIAGMAAVAAYPVGAGSSQPLRFDLFNVHLVPRSNLGNELVYPANEWFLPPSDSYRAWIEGDRMMSPFSMTLYYGQKPFEGRGLVAEIPVLPAGRVRLAEDFEVHHSQELRLLRVDRHANGEHARWEISRRRRVTEVGDGVLMPQGHAVAAIWDDRVQAYVALSRAFRVRPRSTTEPQFIEPIGSHVVALLERSSVARRAEDYDLVPVLEHGGKELRASLKISAADRTYAIWYNVPFEEARLVVRPSATGANEPMTLTKGGIARAVVQLDALPSLDLQFKVDSAPKGATVSVEIRSLPDREVVRQKTLDLRTQFHRLDSLPAAEHEIDFQSVLGSFSAKIDLSSGRDEQLLVKLTPSVSTGDEADEAPSATSMAP